MKAAAVAILTAAPLLPQALTAPAVRYEQFEQHLTARARSITESQLAGIASREEWERRRPLVKQRFLSMLGLDPLPPRTPLNARVTGIVDRGTHRIEKIVFESMPGLYVTGNLYLPARAAGKAPAVIYVSGHSPSPVGAKVQYQHHGVWLARHGYAAFLLDTIEFGEVPGVHHGTHNLGMWYWLSMGYTPAGPEVWNAMRALDYLESRPGIDTSQAAITGISGGGAITWYTAAADERFRVAVPVCATWTAADQAASDAVEENCDCIYFHNAYQLDLTTVAALIAPRPLKILSARRDSMFPPAGYHDVFQRSRRIWELYGVAGRIAEYDHDAPHSDIAPFRKEADEWINRWVRNDTAAFEEGEIRREDAATLRVLDRYPANAVNGSVHRTFIPAARLQRHASLQAWRTRRDTILSQLKQQTFAAFPGTRPPLASARRKESGWTSRYADVWSIEFTSEEGLRIGGQLYIPRDARPPYPALIHVKGADDVVYPVDQDYLLEALGNHVVLVVHARASEGNPNNFRLATLRRTAALAGVTIGSMQVWDILRAVDFLHGEGLALSSMSLYGRREMAALAFYAAALDSRITRVIAEDPPSSHWQGPALLNVLRITDLPGTAALLAPRELVFLGTMPVAFGYTQSIYSLYGAGGKIRQAGSIGRALRVWETRNR